MHLLLEKWNADFSCAASGVSSHFFSLQITSALFVLWDTSVQCRHFVILQSPTLWSNNKDTMSCSLSGGKLRWQQQTRAEQSASSGWWEWLCPKVTGKAAPSLALISGEHGASRPKTFQPLLCESCLNSWWLPSVHGWLLGILDVCSRMHLKLESPASD